MNNAKYIPDARVMLVREAPVGIVIDRSEDAINYMKAKLAYEPNENAVVLAMDNKLRVLGMKTIGIGTVSNCICSPRSAMQYLLLQNANHFILFHNHPSGDPTPSPEDKALTKQFREAGEVMEIRMLDHIIIGTETDTYSFRMDGML